MLRYISCDIETTHLEPDSGDIIQVAMVFDDLGKPNLKVEQMPTFNAYVNKAVYKGSAYAIAMHSEKWKYIAKPDITKCDVIDEDRFIEAMVEFIKSNQTEKFGYPTMAGKNFAMFDWRFIERLPKAKELLKIKHRVIDVGDLYLRKTDSALPGLEECIKRAKIKNESVTHDALNEAQIVVKLIRRKLLR